MLSYSNCCLLMLEEQPESPLQPYLPAASLRIPKNNGEKINKKVFKIDFIWTLDTFLIRKNMTIMYLVYSLYHTKKVLIKVN